MSIKENVIAKIRVKSESLEALKALKAKKAQLRALTEDCKNRQKAILEGLGLGKGMNADIVDGNGNLVATFKTSHRDAFIVDECDVARLTIKTTR